MLDTKSPRSALVLVVEDDVRTARLLVRMLREDGFEVELATDGASAIGRLSQTPMPNILVTDLRMPHGDGVKVAHFARSRHPTLPVLVVTSYPEIFARLQQSMNPAPVVLPKPVDYAVLHAEICRAADMLEGPQPRV